MLLTSLSIFGGGYNGEPSLFDNIGKDDLIMAFFPCVRFEDQILLGFRGEMYQFKDWSIEQKLEYDLNLHNELHELYELITKMVIVAERKDLRLIIENPYTVQHYLQRYWCLKPQLIDKDRRTRGDYYKKPTQYWFVNCEPQNNYILEPQVFHSGWHPVEFAHRNTSVANASRQVARSMISKEYANRFIREQILEEERA